MPQINLGEIEVEVVLKRIKHLHLRVLPPTGRVRISAPRRASLAAIRSFALSKLEWIKRQQVRVREQERETSQESGDQESYVARVKEAVPPLLARWQPLIGVRVDRFFVRPMKSKWGSCTYRTRRIRLNSELAKKPPECLEYVVVHELVHLLEPTHNARFAALMDRFMPQWRSQRRVLNRRRTAELPD
jgi:predicted metal-dependent hydrolase